MQADRLERFTRVFLIFTTIYVSVFAVLSLLGMWLQSEAIMMVLGILRFAYFGPMIYLIVFVNGVLQLVQLLTRRTRANLLRLMLAVFDGVLVIATLLFIFIQLSDALSSF